jgi:hypothetical protein
MSNKVYVPVDPQGFGCGLLLGLLLRYWRQIVIGILLIAGLIFVAFTAMSILDSVNETSEQNAVATQSTVEAAENMRQHLANQDYYLAAAEARALLALDPGNQEALELLDEIRPYVPGGLVVGGVSPTYLPFASTDSIAFYDGQGGELVSVSLASDRGLIVNGQNDDFNSIIDFATGETTLIERGIPDPYLTRVDLFDISAGITFTPMRIAEIATGAVTQVECAAYTSFDTWSTDGSLIMQATGDGINIIDSYAGFCSFFEMPGTAGEPLSDGQRIWIILPGNSTSMEQAQLFELNTDGSGPTKIADLPVYGRDADQRSFLAPDLSAIYLPEGFLVSTRTGAVANTTANAIAWVYQQPIAYAAQPATLVVDPPSGPRGTRFEFAFSGGEPHAQVVMVIEPQVTSGYPLFFLDDYGTLELGTDYFGMDTDLSTASGIYTISVYTSPEMEFLASATYTVTD